MHPDPRPIGEPRRHGLAVGLGLVVLVVALPAAAGLWLHNGLVAKREAVDAAWAQVQSNYQRRADLVPALVQAVERHMRYESQTLEGVVEARNAGLEGSSQAARAARELAEAQGESVRAGQDLGVGAPARAEDLGRWARAQARMSGSIGRLLAIAESYPELRAADHFLELQAQLEGTENRINVARMTFNETVREYNAALDKLPGRAIADARGMERRAYFDTDESARRASPLGFD